MRQCYDDSSNVCLCSSSICPQELFCVCGALKRARLVKVGVAEVVFVRKEDAVSAYRKYNNRCLDGRCQWQGHTSKDLLGSGFCSICRSMTKWNDTSSLLYLCRCKIILMSREGYWVLVPNWVSIGVPITFRKTVLPSVLMLFHLLLLWC